MPLFPNAIRKAVTRHPAGAPAGQGGQFASQGGSASTGDPVRDVTAANSAAANADPAAAGALKQYIEDGETYYELNAYLRGERTGATGTLVDEYEELVINIDDGFKQVKPLTQDITLHRGSLAPSDLKVGQLLAHRGYMSTASGPGAASDFSGAGMVNPPGLAPSMFQIKAPKGTRAWGTKGREAEILLPRGGALRIVGRLPDQTISGEAVKVWEAEYVTDGSQNPRARRY